MDAIARARLSLEGLSLGDGFGERFFCAPEVLDYLLGERAMPAGPWRYTDDTVMALSIVEVLERHGAIESNRLADLFAKKYAEDPDRGYGGGAHRILRAVARGEDWRDLAPSVFGGTGSMGNGGAMRVAPLGAYFADDAERAAFEARRSAEITHAHLEGQAGAIAVAVASAAAIHGEDLLEAAVRLTPASETKSGIERARELPLASSIPVAVEELGNGSQVTAQDTVPFALWCAARHRDDFVEAMWATVSGLGDRDTTCAIVGGIVAGVVGEDALPASWLQAREPLTTLAGHGWPS